MQETARTLDEFVERYESARQDDHAIDVGEFLPAESHSSYAPIAIELLRVDLEYRFENDEAPSLEEYMKRFPLVFESELEVRELAFEHYRLRIGKGETVSADEYSTRFRIDTSDWFQQASTQRPDRRTAVIQLSGEEPRPGGDFENFKLIREIGRGALARVFLAQQTGVANREVVLKFTNERTLEVNRLGRLQHTNIVPILSVHPYGDGSAICMPFLGSQTLRDVQQSAAMPAPVKLVIDLVSGLEHAHSRGVLHRDIKPANILITDYGQALLLDFNLADDLNDQRQYVIGGTPQYMSPEQREAVESGGPMHRPDHRSDIYSVGAVLFEVLTGQRPEPGQKVESGSPAFAAIVNKCITTSPDQRYQSATELLADLQRHQGNQPLLHQSEPSLRERIAKWCRRHPRLSSTASLLTLFGVAAVFAATAFVARSREVRKLQARESFVEAQGELVEVRSLLSLNTGDNGEAAEGIQRGKALLEQLSVSADSELLSAQEATANAESIGELLYYLAQATHRASGTFQPAQRDEARLQSKQYNRQASEWFEQTTGRVPRAVRMQAARLGSLTIEADPSEPVGSLDQLMLAIEHNQTRQFEKTLEYLDRIKSDFASDVSFWNLMGSAHAGRKQFAEADTCFTTCIAFKPGSWVAWSNRGLARMALERFRLAEDDFTEVIGLRPDHWAGYLNRAIARGRQRDYQGAVADLLKAEQFDGPSRIFFLRARYRMANKDRERAISDHRLGLRTTPTDEKSWVSRGIAKLPRQPEAALEDFQQAVKLHNQSIDGLRNIAHVLSERLGRPDEAIAALTKVIEAGVNDSAAFAGRAVLLARSGNESDAVADAEQSLKLSGDAQNRYQNACVFALLAKQEPKHVARAISLLAGAFEQDPSLIEYADEDTDLTNLRSTTDYRSLLRAAQTIHRMKLGKVNSR